MPLLATSITIHHKDAILATTLDIEERKQAEKRARNAERLRTAMIDSLLHPAMFARGIVLY